MDLETLLKPAPTEAPAGPNIQYSQDFANLERTAAGKPERHVGGVSVPAEPPDWVTVIKQSEALLASSKDLRVALTMTRALLETRSFAGFADGLVLVRGLIERFWDSFHPQLDVEDGNDPTARVTSMTALVHRDMMLTLRASSLVVSRALGPVSLRALELAATSGQAKPGSDPKAAAAASQNAVANLEAVFQEVPLDVLSQSAVSLARCTGEARALADAWSARLPDAGPDFTELRRLLAQAEAAVKTRFEQRRGPVNGAVAPDTHGAPAAPPGAPSGSFVVAPVPQGLTGEIRSREDVVKAIDAICAYYARSEPSSPVPLLLQRGKRLVTMSFPDILKELLPDSIANFQKITGKDG
jgi:type VI secretion system protein ImpA